MWYSTIKLIRLLSLAVLLALPAAVQAQFAFTTNNGAITIIRYNTAAGLNVVIPANTNGYPVVSIGDTAFFGQSTITSVTIPNSITNIGSDAFGFCSSLTTVTIPNSVTVISSQAFYGCSGLTNVVIPNSVTSIGEGAFQDCSGLTSVRIPNSVTNIGVAVFGGCSNLTSINVDSTNPCFSSVGGVLFDKAQALLIEYSCGLTGSYTIPNSVIDIGNYAFFGCSGLTSVTIPSSVITIGSSAFVGCSGLTSMNIPSSVINVGSYTFANCSGLTNVIIPNSVTVIGLDAFEYCFGLTKVTIPKSVVSIGGLPFYNCSSLIQITVDPANANYTSVGGVLFDKAAATLIEYPAGLTGGYTIPYSVTSIADSAFRFCSGLTNVTIPSSVMNVGVAAFGECNALHQVYFQGNAPLVDGSVGSSDNTVFVEATGTAYYLAGTTGWGSTFGGWLTAQWYQPQPQIMGSGYGMGIQNNEFQFIISWATNTSVVVEASTNLINWTPIATNSLVNGTNYFSDSSYTNFPKRFYRVHSQ